MASRAVPVERLRLERKRPTGNLQSKDWRFSISAPSISDSLVELVLVGHLSLSGHPQPLAARSHDPAARAGCKGLFYSPHGGIDLTRETMQRRLALQGDVEDKRIAELRARLTETLSALDRERTCRELTRMQGERIKPSLGTAHVRQAREMPPRSRG